MEDTHDGCPACSDPGRWGAEPPAYLSRRALLRIGGAAGAVAAVSPHLRALGAAADGGEPTGARIVARPDWPPPPIVTRAEWGADESIRESGQEFDSVVEKLIVHHTVTPNHPADPSSTVRGVYRYHVSGEYIDIAYNWLIDEQGRIYEGRWARDYPQGEAHTGERRSKQVRGGHSYRHNSRTIGIAMLGTFTTSAPPAVAIDSLVSLLTWKCARWGIDPTGSSLYTTSDGVVEMLPNVIGHRDVRATTCPGDPILTMMPSIRERVAARLRGGSAGYWIASRSGGTLALGDLPDRGDLDAYRLREDIVGIAAHRGGKGYWLVAADGGVFSFGDARFFGSTGGIRLTRPVVGMASTPSGRGYWLVASDGGVFSFGDAAFFGSTGGIRLTRPVVGMAPTPSGEGYWLVASDGGVFNFGDAPFRGSAQPHNLSTPAVALLPSSTGKGYAILTESGAVYTFGDAPYYGGSGGRLPDAVGFAGKLVPQSA